MSPRESVMSRCPRLRRACTGTMSTHSQLMGTTRSGQNSASLSRAEVGSRVKGDPCWLPLSILVHCGSDMADRRGLALQSAAPQASLPGHALASCCGAGCARAEAGGVGGTIVEFEALRDTAPPGRFGHARSPCACRPDAGSSCCGERILRSSTSGGCSTKSTARDMTTRRTKANTRGPEPALKVPSERLAARCSSTWRMGTIANCIQWWKTSPPQAANLRQRWPSPGPWRATAAPAALPRPPLARKSQGRKAALSPAASTCATELLCCCCPA
mmetsp:Transcript_106224/g.317364  ORF Transcript_106224/g.317364 Transcript_106224/m.317364 type:complete len:273 (+) Transcript_106224:731-1549(+)